MAQFCIPKPLAKKLKASAQKGDIKIQELYDMTSAQRSEFFTDITQDKKTAQQINAGFEKAMNDQYQLTMAQWATQVFEGKDKAKRKNIVNKVNKLSKGKLLDPENRTAFAEDLIAEELGVKVTADEALKIDELSEVLRKEEAKGLTELGTYQDSYWVARQKLDNYLLSLVPHSKVKITTSTIRRGLMLASIKSPIVNIVGNTTIGFEQAVERRIKSGVVGGVVDQELVKKYRKSATRIFKKSGFDITRMQDIGEGRKTLGEKITHSQGDGVVRKLGRVMEDTVFKKLLAEPDVWFSAWAVGDSANLQATAQAKSEGLKGKELKERATELFKDAVSISSTSDKGNQIRTQAIADAEFATFTNDGGLAQVSLQARGMLNAFQEDLAIGDQTVPFVKTPANAIQFSFDSGGVSFARALKNFPSAVKDMKKFGNPAPMREVYSDMFRSGFGIMGAILLAGLFNPDDFIGMYPTTSKERELLKLKGATPNSIKIGSRYISLDYFGGFRGSLVGIMNAKKYGGNFVESAYNFARGNVAQLADLPGVEQSGEAVAFIKDVAPEGKLSEEELVRRTKTLTSDYSKSLIFPALLGDIAKAFDTSERQVDWEKPGDRWKASIPGARQTLETKKTVFGEVLKGEPWWSVVLFGARVKSARDNEIVAEIKRLDESGNLPSITRPEWTSTRVKDFKTQISPEKFKKTMDDFRSGYKKQTIRMIKTRSYKKQTDDQKKNELNKIKSDALDRALKKNGYRKPRKKG